MNEVIIVNYLNNNMSTNNDCLEELDTDHNTLENCSAKKCSKRDFFLYNRRFQCEHYLKK